METHLLYSQFLSPFYLLPFVMAAGKRRRRRKSSSSESSGETSFDASEEKKCKDEKILKLWRQKMKDWVKNCFNIQ